jgi:hypothetical protein
VAGRRGGTRAPGAGTAGVRRPRIARAGTPNRASTLIAAAAAVASVAVLVRAAAPAGGDAAPHAIADGVQRLRAAVVGDVGAAGARSASAVPRPAPTLRPASPDRDDRADGGERVRLRVSRRLAEAITPGVPWWADTAHWAPGVVLWTESTRPPVVVQAGDTAVVASPGLPAALPAALRRRGVRWHADGAAALADVPPAAGAGDSLAGAARVVGRAPGAATVTAISPAGRTVVPVRVRPAVRGRVYTVGDDGALGVAAARVIVGRRDGTGADTVVTGGDGRFRAPVPDGWVGAADVRVEPLAAGHDAITLGGVAADELHTLGVVLPPTRWTIAAGEYAGLTVPVRAVGARGFWRTAGPGRPVGWEGEAAKRVAVESDSPPFDTAAFWAAARDLGRAWGRPLFRPAAAGEAPDLVVRVTPGLSAAGMTTLSYDGGGVVAGARVEFRSAATAADPRVAAHELLHALGFGHARGWPSLLGVAGHAGPAAATAADVAHGQLLEAIRRATRVAEREYGAAFGWAGGRP